MKKKYFSPDCGMISMDLENIMAYSLNPNSEGDQSISFSDGEADEFTGRRNDVWGDEEEDY